MINRLSTLYAMQLIDDQLDELEELRGDLPLRVNSLNGKIKEIQDQIDERDNVKKNSNSYNIHVYDAVNLGLIYSKSYYSNLEKYYTSSDMVVDDNATVYNVGKEYLKGKRERKNSKANYSYVSKL